LLVAFFAACLFFRVHRPQDFVAYLGMVRECHPVWRELALRRLGAGDSAADLLRRFPPSNREEFGRYAVYVYYRGSRPAMTRLTVIARDGRLVRATSVSCAWE